MGPAGSLIREDTIGGVLDDADLLSGPTSSNPALTVSAISGGRFTISGTLQPGKILDRAVGLADVPDGYRAMAGREALKVIVQP